MCYDYALWWVTHMEFRILHNGMCVAFVDVQLRRNFYWLNEPIYFLLNLSSALCVFYKEIFQFFVESSLLYFLDINLSKIF